MTRLQRGRAAAALCIASSSLLTTGPPAAAVTAAAAAASHGSPPSTVWQGVSQPRAMSITCFAAPPPRRLATMTSSGGGNGDQKPVVDPFVRRSGTMGKILILGGSGFLGSAVARRAVMDGFAVTSLSRRGRPPPSRRERRRGRIKGAGAGEAGGGADAADKEAPSDVKAAGDAALDAVDYRTGDARDRATVDAILSEGNYTGVVHCVGLLFDASSGLGNYNRLASGSGSIPDASATYDDVTRLTAFNAIEAAEDAARREGRVMAFSFTSAAEAGWPDVPGGRFVEDNLAPDWLRRYLRAKRAVEERLLSSAAGDGLLRPVIFRPSLIYSLDRVASLPPVGAFFVGNKLGLPFVDRPVSVQALSAAVVRSLEDEDVTGVQRYKEIEALSK